MGLRSVGYISERLTNGIEYILRKCNVQVVNYLDDIAGCDTWDKAGSSFKTTQEVLATSELQEAKAIACLPSTVMTFLGIKFDTEKMTLEIMPDRLVEIQDGLNLWLGRETCKIRDLQEIIGKLNFVTSCVWPVRIFMAQLLAQRESK